MRRMTLAIVVLVLGLLLGGSGGVQEVGAQGYLSRSEVTILNRDTCFDQARYQGYILGTARGGPFSWALLTIQRARDGQYWDGWRFVPWKTSVPITLEPDWRYYFPVDYGLYVLHIEAADIWGGRVDAKGHLVVQVRPDEFVYQSTRDGNTDVYRAQHRGFAVGPVRLTDHAAYDGAPVFSPDHQFVAFESNRNGNFEIYVIDSSYGRTIYRITDHAADDRAPTWSPDGKRLAWHSNRDGNYEIYTADIPYGTDVRRITNHPADDMYPAWSPQITRIAFQSNRDEGRFKIFLTSWPYGTFLHKVSRAAAGQDITPSYAPDGRYLAFSSDRSGNFDVYLMESYYGYDVRHVTRNSPSMDTNPVWHSFCTDLLYQSDAAGTPAVFAVDNPFYGAGIRRVTLDAFINLLRGLTSAAPSGQ